MVPQQLPAPTAEPPDVINVTSLGSTVAMQLSSDQANQAYQADCQATGNCVSRRVLACYAEEKSATLGIPIINIINMNIKTFYCPLFHPNISLLL